MRTNTIAAGAACAIASIGMLTAAGQSAAQNPAASIRASVSHVRACPGPAAPFTARCHAHVVVDRSGRPQVTSGPAGYTPTDLRGAYSISGSGTASTVVAVVDAYGYPNAERDLGVYRAKFGLPPCTTANGCFRKVNQNGVAGNYPIRNTGWSQETALDLDMVSAMCPNCSILLVEANTSSFRNLALAVSRAASLGAHAISNSYGGSESNSSPYESYYDYSGTGIAVTASSGDNGYGVEFPASSPHVTAVGGTTLVRDSSSGRGWSETAWSGAGSGCSALYPKPSWQTDSGCANRTIADVSAVADPSTGVAVYGPTGGRTSGWMVFGGTSVAAPLVAGLYGLNGNPATFGSDPYNHVSALYDVSSGSNGSCSGSYLCDATVGYDGPTGLGTPDGDNAFGP